MTEAQIKHMVDRFLSWRLPENFNPDCGISFKATHGEGTDYPGKYEPTGTNLFDGGQAQQMVRHMVGGLANDKRQGVYAAIDSERDYQDQKWAESGTAGDGVLSIGDQILLIEEYAAQARRSWSQEKQPEIGALNIIRKIAGIAVHCMEDHGAPKREQP